MIGRLFLSYFAKRNIRGLAHIGKGSTISGIPKCIHGRCLSIGDNVDIHSGVRIENNSGKTDVKITIGNNCCAWFNFTILAGADVTIGNNIAIASDVFISSGGHMTDPECDIPYGGQPYVGKEIVIKDGAWIGQKVCIMGGCTIGTKSIIGAGSVVVDSIPDYCIAVGNPARVVKKYNFEKHEWEKVD